MADKNGRLGMEREHGVFGSTRRIVSHVAGALWGCVLALILWQIVAWIVKSPALPAPFETVQSCVQYMGEIGTHLWISLYRVLASLALGVGLAFPVALFTARNQRVDDLLAPLLYILYPIPKVVFLPVLLVLLGIEDAPKLALITLTVFFQVLVTERDALQNVDESLLVSARSMGASNLQLYTQVLIPATLPTLFTTLRITSGTAISVLFIAESIAGTSGLGYFIVNAWGLVNYPQMFAGILAMALLGLVLYELIGLIERIVLPWRYRVE